MLRKKEKTIISGLSTIKY